MFTEEERLVGYRLHIEVSPRLINIGTCSGLLATTACNRRAVSSARLRWVGLAQMVCSMDELQIHP